MMKSKTSQPEHDYENMTETPPKLRQQNIATKTPPQEHHPNTAEKDQHQKTSAPQRPNMQDSRRQEYRQDIIHTISQRAGAVLIFSGLNNSKKSSGRDAIKRHRLHFQDLGILRPVVQDIPRHVSFLQPADVACFGAFHSAAMPRPRVVQVSFLVLECPFECP